MIHQERIDKQTVVHPYSGILFTNKKGGPFVHAATWMNLKAIILSERSQTKRYILMIPLT